MSIEQQPKNYEEIFIATIEYIKDNPECLRERTLNHLVDKFNLTNSSDAFFLSQAIEKTTLQFHSTNDTRLIIHPDALFYLMEYKELKHSLEESKLARKQATWSTWFAVVSIAISIVGLGASIYYSKKQIELSKQQMETTK